jgi:hypothetical protein
MDATPATPGRTDPVQRYERALLAYLRATDESAEPLDVLIADRPYFLPARLLAIGKYVAAKHAGALGRLDRALDAARPLERSATDAERASLAAAHAWLAGEHARAARMYSELALAAPDDLLSLRLAQSCWYFLGQRNCVRAIAERVAERARESLAGYDCALAMHAFGCAENGDGAGAEALARRALAVAPDSPYAIHALAHALAIQRRSAEGASLLAATAWCWRGGGRMAAHNAWHFALFRLETGDRAAALAAVEHELLPAAGADVGTAADAADLLWRLDLTGLETEGMWPSLARVWAEHPVPGFWGFLDVLAGFTFARAGQAALARRLAQRVARAVAESTCADGRSMRLATMRALTAVEAFTAGDFERAHAALGEVLPRLGGSLPQRELLELTRDAALSRLAARANDVAAAA